MVHCEPLGDPANGHTAPVEFGHEWTLLFSTCLLYHWRSSPRCSSWKPSFDTGRELSSVFKVRGRPFPDCNSIVPYCKHRFRPRKSIILGVVYPRFVLPWHIRRYIEIWVFSLLSFPQSTGRYPSSVFKVPCRTFLNCNTIVPYSKFWFRPRKSWILRLFSPVLHLFWCILRCSVFLLPEVFSWTNRSAFFSEPAQQLFRPPGRFSFLTAVLHHRFASILAPVAELLFCETLYLTVHRHKPTEKRRIDNTISVKHLKIPKMKHPWISAGPHCGPVWGQRGDENDTLLSPASLSDRANFVISGDESAPLWPLNRAFSPPLGKNAPLWWPMTQ